MKVSIITLASVVALSSTYAIAQGGGNSLDEMAASSATRSAMNSMHRKHHDYHVQDVQPAETNCLGLNSLGVTTNSGRKYNGG
jgi:hypothetical protein